MWKFDFFFFYDQYVNWSWGEKSQILQMIVEKYEFVKDPSKKSDFCQSISEQKSQISVISFIKKNQLRSLFAEKSWKCNQKDTTSTHTHTKIEFCQLFEKKLILSIDHRGRKGNLVKGSRWKKHSAEKNCECRETMSKRIANFIKWVQKRKKLWNTIGHKVISTPQTLSIGYEICSLRKFSLMLLCQ